MITTDIAPSREELLPPNVAPRDPTRRRRIVTMCVLLAVIVAGNALVATMDSRVRYREIFAHCVIVQVVLFSVWGVFGRTRWPIRYVSIGVILVVWLTLSKWISPPWASINEIGSWTLIVAWFLLSVLKYLGWQLQTVDALTRSGVPSVRARRIWQFSISDMLRWSVIIGFLSFIVTHFRAELQLRGFVVVAVLILPAILLTFGMLTASTAKRRNGEVIVGVLLYPAIVVMLNLALKSTPPISWETVLFFGIAPTLLLMALAVIRFAGYRLVVARNQPVEPALAPPVVDAAIEPLGM